MHQVRPAAVAGMFYPAAPAELLRDVDALLGGADATASRAVPKAVIVPHAGYVYSGPVAATAYAALRPAGAHVRRVVLLGPAHRAYVRGLALPDADAFATPLGAVPIDAEALARIPWVPRSAAAHAMEHSLEVQLPFLIRVLGRGTRERGVPTHDPAFALVPLAVGDASPEEVARVLEALWGGPETLVVISSDLSHYLPYAVARRVDTGTAQAILALGPEPLDHDQACGATPINGLLVVARRKGLRPELLDLRNSGDTAGGRDEVVGYASFAFHESAPDREEPAHA